MKEKYIVKEIETGVLSVLDLEYREVLDAGIQRIITKKGSEFKIVEKDGSNFGGAGTSRRNKLVTKRSSLAAGVHRDQVEEARGVAKQLNPGIEINRDGTVSFGSRRARKDWLKHNKLRDNDGGYGD